MAYTNPQIAELLAQRNALETQIAEARERETRLALIEIVQKVREYGITLNDLLGPEPSAGIARSSATTPRCRDPVTGATWTGRGCVPRWIAGKDREEFRLPMEEKHRVAQGEQRSLSF